MIKNREIFSEIYFVENPNNLNGKQWDNLLMSGKKNFDHYFKPFKTKHEVEIISDVELIEFSKEEEMFAFLKMIKPEKLINFSLEHENPMVLKYVS